MTTYASNSYFNCILHSNNKMYELQRNQNFRFSHEGWADLRVEPTQNCRISEFGQRHTQPIFKYMGTRVT